MIEMRIHGYGGQGTVTLAQLIAVCGLNAGMQSQALPFFGVERRGSAVKAAVRISEEDIRMRSQSIAPDFLIVMSENLLDIAIEGGISENYSLLLNTPNEPTGEVETWYLDASAVAVKNNLIINGVPYANIPMLGASCKKIGISAEVLEKTLRDKWQGVIGEKNVKAAIDGYNEVKCIGGAK